MEIEPESVLDFWIAAGPKKWWKKDEQFDADITREFGGLHMQAATGQLDHWVETPEGALALILVLDQFSRNLFRNSPYAFAQDAKCVGFVNSVMEAGLDRKMRPDIGEFCYLPLMHAENISDQERCLSEMERLNKEGNIKAAKEHLDIIKRFGRFPHRNAVLGRETTVEEQAFLEVGGFSG